MHYYLFLLLNIHPLGWKHPCVIFRCAIHNVQKVAQAQCADGESNKIVYDKKKAVRAWLFNTYWVRNHFVPNPVNSKSIRLKKNLEKLKSKNHNIEKVRTNEKICMVQYWELPADWSISVSLNQQTIVLCLILLSKK